jgi:vitamin B12 transporter
MFPINPIETLTLRADYTFTEANDEILRSGASAPAENKVSLDAKWQATRDLSFDASLLYVGPWLDVTRDSVDS